MLSSINSFGLLTIINIIFFIQHCCASLRLQCELISQSGEQSNVLCFSECFKESYGQLSLPLENIVWIVS